MINKAFQRIIAAVMIAIAFSVAAKIQRIVTVVW